MKSIPPCSVSKGFARMLAYFEQTGLSKNQIAQTAKLSGESALRRFRRSGWNPTIETVLAMDAIVPEDFMPSQSPDPANGNRSRKRSAR